MLCRLRASNKSRKDWEERDSSPPLLLLAEEEEEDSNGIKATALTAAFRNDGLPGICENPVEGSGGAAEVEVEAEDDEDKPPALALLLLLLLLLLVGGLVEDDMSRVQSSYSYSYS